MAKRTRSKKRLRKKTIRGGMTPIVMAGIGVGAVGIAAALYSFLHTPPPVSPPQTDYSDLDITKDNLQLPTANV